MGFDYYDVDPDQVHPAGQAEARQATDWEAWSGDVRTFLEDALDSVRDGRISGALATRAGDINQAAGRLVTDVGADGENIASGAARIVSGEEESVVTQTVALSQAQTVLGNRRIPI